MGPLNIFFTGLSRQKSTLVWLKLMLLFRKTDNRGETWLRDAVIDDDIVLEVPMGTSQASTGDCSHWKGMSKG